MNTQEILKQQLAHCDECAANIAIMRRRLPELVPILNALPSLRYCYHYPMQARVIMAVKTRDDLAVVRALHKGYWQRDKAPEADDDDALCIEYRAVVDEVEIICRVDELPPSCKVKEERVEVPAHTRVVRRLVCNDPSREHAEKGEVMSVEEFFEVGKTEVVK